MARRGVAILAAAVAACSSGSGSRPTPVTPVVSSKLDRPFLFPDDPCDLLTPGDVASASGVPVNSARRVPDIGEIIRAQKEHRAAHASAVCSYDGERDAEITISIPAVADQNAAAYLKERDAYFSQSHGEQVSGVGQDAWIGGGAALHVLVGKHGQFVVAAMNAGEKSRDAVIRVAKAAIAKLSQ